MPNNSNETAPAELNLSVAANDELVRYLHNVTNIGQTALGEMLAAEGIPADLCEQILVPPQAEAIYI